MNFISLTDMWNQIKKDLIGKDSYRGVTFSYTWLANQVGHFSLGFIPTFLIYEALLKWYNIDNPAMVAPGIITCSWLAFEIYNFLGPLLLKGNLNSDSDLFELNGSKYVFAPEWWNIASDTLTDVLFFALGATVCKLIIGNTFETQLLCLFLVCSVCYFGEFWYKTKMYQQYALYPLQIRLSQWENNITESNKQLVQEYMSKIDENKHLLLFGSKNTGKTNLGIGIANELSIKHRACTYTTAMKLISMFHENERDQRNNDLWTWHDSELLVIDDLNPGKPIKEDLITPIKLLEYIDAQAHTETNRNRHILKNKSVIWILGDQEQDQHLQSNWQSMLNSIGIKNENIWSINL